MNEREITELFKAQRKQACLQKIAECKLLRSWGFSASTIAGLVG